MNWVGPVSQGETRVQNSNANVFGHCDDVAVEVHFDVEVEVEIEGDAEVDEHVDAENVSVSMLLSTYGVRGFVVQCVVWSCRRVVRVCLSCSCELFCANDRPCLFLFERSVCMLSACGSVLWWCSCWCCC